MRRFELPTWKRRRLSQAPGRPGARSESAGREAPISCRSSRTGSSSPTVRDRPVGRGGSPRPRSGERTGPPRGVRGDGPDPRAGSHGASRLSRHRGERRPRGLRAGPQSGDRGGQPVQRGALGRHGAAVHRPGRGGRDRRAQGRAPRSADVVLPRRSAHRAGAGRAARGARRRPTRDRTAAARTCATPRGASWTSPSSVWPRSSRCRTACAPRHASPWPRWRPCRSERRRPSSALEGQRPTPERIARAAELAVDAARPISDQRGSADYRRHLVKVLTRRTLTTALARASA